MKKGIWMGKKKERKAASRSVRKCGHCMKQQHHHYNWSLEFISTFLMYSLSKSSHSITAFHCNFCGSFEERRERLSTGKRTAKQASWNAERGKVWAWIILWKIQKERKELDQSQRGESSKEWTNKGWIRLCSSEEVALSGFHSWVVVSSFHW